LAVRAGGGNGGTLDTAYSKRAAEVWEGKITTAKQLNDAMKDIVPTDAQLQAEFSTCRVTKASLARYYLRALGLCYRGEKEAGTCKLAYKLTEVVEKADD